MSQCIGLLGVALPCPALAHHLSITLEQLSLLVTPVNQLPMNY